MNWFRAELDGREGLIPSNYIGSSRVMVLFNGSLLVWTYGYRGYSSSGGHLFLYLPCKTFYLVQLALSPDNLMNYVDLIIPQGCI